MANADILAMAEAKAATVKAAADAAAEAVVKAQALANDKAAKAAEAAATAKNDKDKAAAAVAAKAAEAAAAALVAATDKADLLAKQAVLAVDRMVRRISRRNNTKAAKAKLKASRKAAAYKAWAEAQPAKAQKAAGAKAKAKASRRHAAHWEQYVSANKSAYKADMTQVAWIAQAHRAEEELMAAALKAKAKANRPTKKRYHHKRHSDAVSMERNRKVRFNSNSWAAQFADPVKAKLTISSGVRFELRGYTRDADRLIVRVKNLAERLVRVQPQEAAWANGITAHAMRLWAEVDGLMRQAESADEADLYDVAVEAIYALETSMSLLATKLDAYWVDPQEAWAKRRNQPRRVRPQVTPAASLRDRLKAQLKDFGWTGCLGGLGLAMIAAGIAA